MRLFKRNPTRHAYEPETLIGRAVLSRDEAALGYIKEVTASAFKVDVPMGRDYWLHTSAIQQSTERGVVVDFERDELDRHKIEAGESSTELIEGAVENELIRPSQSDRIISDEEQMQQRERMERELAEQRRRLHDN